MKLLILAKSGNKDDVRAVGRGIPVSSLKEAAKRGDAMPGKGDLIEFASDRFTDKGPATATVEEVKTTVDGYYLKLRFADGQATLSWDDMQPSIRRMESGRGWLVKGGDWDAKYQRLLERRTGGDPEAMAAENARFTELAAHCTGPAAVEAIRADDAAIRAKVREDFGIEYASEGGYAAEVIDFQGFEVVVENPAGSVRAGVDPDGKAWATQMTASYGYISGTEGADGDMVDVFIGPDAGSQTAYVARCQVAGKWGTYDEDKVMLGFPSEESARQAFLENYNDPRFLGALDAMSIDKLKERLQKPGRLAKSILFFTKAHVGPYMRQGKLVNLAGYHGRDGRAQASAGQMSLFGSNEPAGPNPYKGKHPVHDTMDLFADADEHGEVPPGRVLMRRSDTVTEPRQELIEEHERLVDVLRSPSHEDDKEEAEKQAAELAEYKAGEESKPIPILLLTAKRKDANAQKVLTSASSEAKVKPSETSDTARRESGAQEKNMNVEEMIKRVKAHIESKPGYSYDPSVMEEVVRAGVVPDGTVIRETPGADKLVVEGDEIVQRAKGGAVMKRIPMDDRMREAALAKYAEFKSSKPRGTWNDAAPSARTMDQIKADIAKLDAENEEWQKQIKRAKKVDRVQNEGGGGYSHGDALADERGREYIRRRGELDKELFAAEWTRDVTEKRRAAWNAEVSKLKSPTVSAVGAIQRKLGYGPDAIKRAKALHGIQ